MSAINTAIGVQYTLTEYLESNKDFDTKIQTTLGGGQGSPFIEGHELTFKGWAIVVPNPYTDNRGRRHEGTPKQVPVFVDGTTGTDVNVWLSYFRKVAKDYSLENDRKKSALADWNTQSLPYGGEMGAWVRDNLLNNMTNIQIRQKFEEFTKGKTFVVHRHSYKLAHTISATNSAIIVDDADFAEFNEKKA